MQLNQCAKQLREANDREGRSGLSCPHPRNQQQSTVSYIRLLCTHDLPLLPQGLITVYRARDRGTSGEYVIVFPILYRLRRTCSPSISRENYRCVVRRKYEGGGEVRGRSSGVGYVPEEWRRKFQGNCCWFIAQCQSLFCQTSLCSMAQRVAALREVMPSLLEIERRCASTVRVLTTSCSAIWA